jgi:type II secretory pathway predicted ATPase ExeA
MFNLSRLETFVNCGFKHDPFKSVDFKTADSMRIQRILSMGIKGHSMVSIIGERGFGKTRAINAALKKLEVRQVTVRSADKAKLLISDIEQAMILDLSDEKPLRGKEIRARQLRRILGKASIKNDVVVVIEEGHRLHGMTLRALKTLREMDWLGKTDLFSVVLVAQSDPMGKPGVSEVRLRSDAVYMKGLTTSEISSYIQSTVGKKFSADAVNMIAGNPEAANFLDLQEKLVRMMGRMISIGSEQVDTEIVMEEFNILQSVTPKPPVKPKSKVPKKPSKDIVEKGNDTLRSLLKDRQGDDEPDTKMVAVG